MEGDRSGGNGNGFDVSRPPLLAVEQERDFPITHLEVERFRASAGQIRAQHPVHDRDDDSTVAVCREEVESDKVIDERSPVSVCEVDGRRDHGLTVRLGHFGDEAEIEQAELARVRAGRDLEEVACGSDGKRERGGREGVGKREAR